METLAKFKEVQGGDVRSAAKQLLEPLANTVKLTAVAKRHLTAVLDCKEISDMATKKSAKKFEGPKTVKTKSTKAAKKAEGTERKSSLFRLNNSTAKEWGAFGGQKGEIVAAFKSLGAVGAKATGVTRAALCTALPDVSKNNISFYLSKWQPAKIVEKLAAE